MLTTEGVHTLAPAARPRRRRSLALTAVVAALALSAFAPRADAATTWFIGNGDWLVLYTITETRNLDPGNFPTTSSWERRMCLLMRRFPASLHVRTVCTAANAWNTISGWRLRWFIDNARRWNACSAVVFDYGRHGINQFQKRWKVRAAEDYFTGLDVPWVSSRFTHVRLSNPSNSYRSIRCTG